MQKVLFKFLFLSGFAVQALIAQTFSATLLDAKSQLPVPYASIVYGKEQGVITNEEGLFSFTMTRDTKPLDSVYISCMGATRAAIRATVLNQLRKLYCE